ncbi:hypothetical protein NM22_14360 [Vibrio tubiashii]|nr:hypothetical protein NM22_14360 [Vibrio tubiashii]
MNILIFLVTIVIAKYIGAQISVTYDIVSDPFNFKRALFDFVLYGTVYMTLNYIYDKGKAALKKLRQN